jgi:hypothetical protein
MRKSVKKSNNPERKRVVGCKRKMAIRALGHYALFNTL